MKIRKKKNKSVLIDIVVENEDPAKNKSVFMEGVMRSASHAYASLR